MGAPRELKGEAVSVFEEIDLQMKMT